MAEAASTLQASSCSSVFAGGLDCTASPFGFNLDSYSFYSTSFPVISSAALSNNPGSLTAPLSASFLWYPSGSSNPAVNYTIVAETTSGKPASSTGSADQASAILTDAGSATPVSLPSAGDSAAQQTGASSGTTAAMTTAGGLSAPSLSSTMRSAGTRKVSIQRTSEKVSVIALSVIAWKFML